MTGHLLGAAGAVEALLCVRALETGLLPPTINLDAARPGVRARPRREQGAAGEGARVALSNSFGFGGTNASRYVAGEASSRCAALLRPDRESRWSTRASPATARRSGAAASARSAGGASPRASASRRCCRRSSSATSGARTTSARSSCSGVRKACTKRPVSENADRAPARPRRAPPAGDRARPRSRRPSSATSCSRSRSASTRSRRAASPRCSAASRAPRTTRASSTRRRAAGSPRRRRGLSHGARGARCGGRLRAGAPGVAAAPGRTRPSARSSCAAARRARRGFTRPPGGPHAEVVALERRAPRATAPRRCAAPRSRSPSSPAASPGARRPAPTRSSPPASRASASASRDPNPRVGGRGLRQLLRAAGVAVETGVLEEACREQHRGFLSRSSAAGPVVTLKLAATPRRPHRDGARRVALDHRARRRARGSTRCAPRATRSPSARRTAARRRPGAHRAPRGARRPPPGARGVRLGASRSRPRAACVARRGPGAHLGARRARGAGRPPPRPRGGGRARAPGRPPRGPPRPRAGPRARSGARG